MDFYGAVIRNDLQNGWGYKPYNWSTTLLKTGDRAHLVGIWTKNQSVSWIVGCTPNSVAMAFIVFSTDSWGLQPINK